MQIKSDKKSVLIEEYKQYSHLRILSLVLIGIIGIALIAGIFFVYNNIYSAINKSQANILLYPIANVEAVDFIRYEAVNKAWEEKYNQAEIVINRDPFNPVSVEEE